MERSLKNQNDVRYSIPGLPLDWGHVRAPEADPGVGGKHLPCVSVCVREDSHGLGLGLHLL